MTRIRVSTVVEARPGRVWDDLRHIDRHVEWMGDAERIWFLSAQREGVGTAFECATRVGPFRLTDRMVVTEWGEARRIGIRHEGLVRGTGRFTIRPARRGRTRFTWTERLRFPWWMGGPVGAAVGGLVLRRVWRRNLATFAARFG